MRKYPPPPMRAASIVRNSLRAPAVIGRCNRRRRVRKVPEPLLALDTSAFLARLTAPDGCSGELAREIPADLGRRNDRRSARRGRAVIIRCAAGVGGPGDDDFAVAAGRGEYACRGGSAGIVVLARRGD